jgi:hypothetical protein
MTPKEKANEIFSKMYNEVYDSYGTEIGFIAKQCALIAVDEIIKSNPIFVTSKLEGKDGMHEAYLYWKKVKQELEKL